MITKETYFNPAAARRPDIITDPLYVITPIFNPQRYRTRWKLYTNFEKHVLDSGAILVTIEAAFGDREYVFKESTNPNHIVINLRASSELWIKENLINLAIQRLPETSKYIAWIDGDIKFLRDDWVGETIHKLQHHSVIQMFKVAVDVDANFLPYQFNYGFAYDYLSGLPLKMQFTKSAGLNTRTKVQKKPIRQPYCDDCDCEDGELRINHFHGGFAWAYRKQALSDLGGLFDKAVLGAGDSHMASSFVGAVNDTIHPKMSEEYKRLLNIWQERALKYVNGDIGYVDGTIHHFFHGAKKNRKYGERWKILIDEQYTPSEDIKPDWNGIYKLEGNKPSLKRKIQEYFSGRNEDNIDMEGVVGFL